MVRHLPLICLVILFKLIIFSRNLRQHAQANRQVKLWSGMSSSVLSILSSPSKYSRRLLKHSNSRISNQPTDYPSSSASINDAPKQAKTNTTSTLKNSAIFCLYYLSFTSSRFCHRRRHRPASQSENCAYVRCSSVIKFKFRCSVLSQLASQPFHNSLSKLVETQRS